ncbi:predicted protein [Nematostella vectensis]|uniref:Centrosomal protein POC5 n=1 Tax=Nematostella vectensis TaxID=45351 RepID=A7SNC1_NEMVE|nr:predicted protein [Nematostella vectensis]|eukprot:XP_001626927.1 predicted protein [Nematostella vectensis]
MSSDSDNSAPLLPDNDSPGSSVSSSMQREYEELLKYAVVTPRLQLAKSIYEQSQPTKPVQNRELSVNSSSETSSKSESTSSSTTTTTESSQSTYVEEVSKVAREDVAGLPTTPAAPIPVALMGAGSLARNSLLRESSTPVQDQQGGSSNDSSVSERSDTSPGSAMPSPSVDTDLLKQSGENVEIKP